MRPAIVIEKAENNDAASVPDLPGWVATGKTVEETEQQIPEAFEFHVRGFISGAIVKKMSLKVESSKRADGERAYAIA